MMWMIQWWRSPVSPSGSERSPRPRTARAWSIACPGPGAGRLPTKCVPRMRGRNLHLGVAVLAQVLALAIAVALTGLLANELRLRSRLLRGRDLQRVVDVGHA